MFHQWKRQGGKTSSDVICFGILAINKNYVRDMTHYSGKTHMITIVI